MKTKTPFGNFLVTILIAKLRNHQKRLQLNISNLAFFLKELSVKHQS